MKKMNKKVVVATTVSIASMLLNAACGYGPPVDEVVEYQNSNEITTQESTDTDKDSGKDSQLDSFDYNQDDYPEPEPEDVYGPPLGD